MLLVELRMLLFWTSKVRSGSPFREVEPGIDPHFLVVGLTNPSNIDLDTGNVTFQLFGKGGAFLGTAVLPVSHFSFL